GRIARLDPEAGLLWFGSARFLVIAAALILAGGLMMRSMPPVADLSLRSPRGAARRLLSDPGVRRILLFGFLANLAMQGPCQQLALILKAHGAEVRDVADTWRIPLVLEAVVIAFAWKLTQWLGPAGLVRLGLLAECIRWTASGLTDDLVMLQWLQLGHGISVTGILIGIPMLLERDVARELRSTAQALSASIGNGVGAVLSNLLLGWALDHFDDGVPLLVAGFLQGGLLLASLRWLR
ncbi:MAG: MFS transporter, partial [Planctomycetes bacterium]|nr:MFS transporter [Planctomycetota bacterium]